jgi:uncharacterized protein YfaQ (DUF2300 family)
MQALDALTKWENNAKPRQYQDRDRFRIAPAQSDFSTVFLQEHFINMFLQEHKPVRKAYLHGLRELKHWSLFPQHKARIGSLAGLPRRVMRVFLQEHISITLSHFSCRTASWKSTVRVLHKIHWYPQQFVIAFEIRSALCCEVALLLRKISWDV